VQDTSTDTTVTRGLLLEHSPGRAVIALPGSDYQLHLLIPHPVEPGPHGEVSGRIAARALKVDRVGTGGLFIEPLYGRPRRVQGRVVSRDAAANTLTVAAPCVVVAQLDVTQRATDFPLGDLVACNIQNGSSWLSE